MKTVSDLMTRQVATVRPSSNVASAGRLMWECDCGAVPVLDEQERVVAMITDRDICMAAVLTDRAPSAIPVSEVMSAKLRYCAPKDSVAQAEQTMRAHQLRRLPVLDPERRLVGILSLADIVRTAQADKGPKKDLALDEVTATLADICTPREEVRADSARA